MKQGSTAGSKPIADAAPKAVSRGIPLLPRHSTAGAAAGATALQTFVLRPKYSGIYETADCLALLLLCVLCVLCG